MSYSLMWCILVLVRCLHHHLCMLPAVLKNACRFANLYVRHNSSHQNGLDKRTCRCAEAVLQRKEALEWHWSGMARRRGIT